MIRTRSICLTALFLLLALIPSVTATLVLSDVAFTPTAPLVPGSQQQMIARYAIIPSGSTTFAKGHEFQMQTGLSNAKWSIQITLDGRNAAQQSASGNAAFVNGEILSYSTNHDVGMIVTINGIVPQDATSPLMILQIDEIDNSGSIVPGSTLTISQQVTGQAPAAPSAPVPTLTLPLVTPASQPTKAAGLTTGALFAVLAVGLLAGLRYEK